MSPARQTSIVARCGCGATYTPEQWAALTSRRPWVFPDEVLEIAECSCKSTISIQLATNDAVSA